MKRFFTAAVAIPIVLVLTKYAPDWLFAVLVAAVSALALEEFLALGAARNLSRPGKWLLPFGGALTASFMGGPAWVVTTWMLGVIALMTAAIFAKPLDNAFGWLIIGLAGAIYCCFLPGFLILLSRESIFTLFAIVWVGDSAAYYCGRAFGKHRLAPMISPGKTIEGAAAGLAGSVLAGTFMSTWLLGETYLWGAVVSAIAAVAGQVGDLSESVLKRSAGVKDSSSILPGHGGILDRLDSLLFAAPVLYFLMQVI